MPVSSHTLHSLSVKVSNVDGVRAQTAAVVAGRGRAALETCSPWRGALQWKAATSQMCISGAVFGAFLELGR